MAEPIKTQKQAKVLTPIPRSESSSRLSAKVKDQPQQISKFAKASFDLRPMRIKLKNKPYEVLKFGVRITVTKGGQTKLKTKQYTFPMPVSK